MWLGGIQNNCWLSDEQLAKHPAIAAVAFRFNDFQNSQWRGEWEQNLPSFKAGQVRDLLTEIAALLKNQKQ